jgi:hypothetical protein
MRRILLASLVLLTAACSSSSIEFNDVVSIPAGDKEGTALSGSFAVIYEVKGDGCSDVSALGIPVSGSRTPLDIEVTQTEGALTFGMIDETTLRGGVDFENNFELGGGSVLSRGGDENILRLIRLTGSFQNGDNFTGEGEERLTGKIIEEEVDCTFSFEVTGVRKPA